MADPKLAALSKVPLFASCTPRELQFVAGNTDEVRVPAGKELTTQGTRSHTFYVMLDGHASVRVDGEDRGTLGPGDFFGEISMLDQGEGTATVTTTNDCRMMVMSHSQFRDVVKAHDEILVRVLEAMAKRLRRDLEFARSELEAR